MREKDKGIWTLNMPHNSDEVYACWLSDKGLRIGRYLIHNSVCRCHNGWPTGFIGEEGFYVQKVTMPNYTNVSGPWATLEEAQAALLMVDGGE